MTRLWAPPPHRTPPRTVTVTERQAQVLTGLLHGLTYEEIGRALFLSEHTVKSHAKRLYRAMGARCAAHAVGLACTGRVRVEVGA